MDEDDVATLMLGLRDALNRGDQVRAGELGLTLFGGAMANLARIAKLADSIDTHLEIERSRREAQA